MGDHSPQVAFSRDHMAELKALEAIERTRDYNVFPRLTIRLPWAPSVNNAYPTGKNGRRFPSRVLKAFKLAVWGAIYEQRIPRRNLAHPLSVTITQHAKTAAGDIDNGVKAVLDALVQAHVIADDNRQIVRRITVEDGARSKNPYVLVTVEPVI